jgi:hypothetical protein
MSAELLLHAIFEALKTRVSVTGSVRKEVRCEKCATAYSYEMTRTVGEAGHDQRVALQLRAGLRLQVALAEEHELRPCPLCGWYQCPMVRFARRQAMHNVRWWLLGAFIWVASFGAGAGITADFAGRNKPIPEFVPAILGLASLSGLLFVPAFLSVRLYRRFLHNPNGIGTRLN